jgi:hypothetical protein
MNNVNEIYKSPERAIAKSKIRNMMRIKVRNRRQKLLAISFQPTVLTASMRLSL